jgi:hypothetical protein
MEDELLELLDAGLIFDRSEKPIRPSVTIVATQRSDRLEVVEEFLTQLQQIHPHARLVVGDTSSVEKEAVRTATMIGMDYEIIEKAEKGSWDAGGNIRDERVVARASHVVLLDSSARSEGYRKLALLQKKHISTI